MNILIFIAQYGPLAHASGPAKSVREMVDQLEPDHDISIVSRAAFPGPEAGIVPDRWHYDTERLRRFYSTRPAWDFSATQRLIRDVGPQIVYLNSFFQFSCSIAPLVTMRLMGGDKPQVCLAPRGELCGEALREKRTKKLMFRMAAKLAGLHREVVFHAGGSRDAADIEALFPANRRVHALDIGEARTAASVKPRSPHNALKLLFLSRIVPMKNLEFAFAALRRCEMPVNFEICGPIEDADYVAGLKAEAKSLPDHIGVEWNPAVEADQVIDKMEEHDLLFLPTRGENFCHVIHEALCAGTPVLISDRTNWNDHIANDLSWALPLEDGPQAFAAIIDQVARESDARRNERRRRLLEELPAMRARSQAIADTRTLFSRVASA